jgi:hypothetical protein
MQRKGIATQLLKCVCKDATDDGFDFGEAYVNNEFLDATHDFRGLWRCMKNVDLTNTPNEKAE